MIVRVSHTTTNIDFYILYEAHIIERRVTYTCQQKRKPRSASQQRRRPLQSERPRRNPRSRNSISRRNEHLPNPRGREMFVYANTLLYARFLCTHPHQFMLSIKTISGKRTTRSPIATGSFTADPSSVMSACERIRVVPTTVAQSRCSRMHTRCTTMASVGGVTREKKWKRMAIKTRNIAPITIQEIMPLDGFNISTSYRHLFKLPNKGFCPK